MTKLTIILPSKDRAKVLSDTLVELSKCEKIDDCELILCDDGSTDETLEVMEQFKVKNPNLSVIIFSDGHKGVAAQRNRAATIASGQILLFTADDIRPENRDWLSSHIELHSHQTSNLFCVLGKISWPASEHLNVNLVMQTVQGKAGEQFGYADLNSNSFLDWRFFYTSNLSIKKNLVSDWMTEGFSTQFKDYGYEDIEFAYRIMNNTDLRLFYSSMVPALHFQEISVQDFCNRQMAAGRMAATFVELQSSLKGLIAPNPKYSSYTPTVISHVLNLVQGLKSYAQILEHDGRLGRDAWHQDLLHLLFMCEYRIGLATNSRFENQGHLVNEFVQILNDGLEIFSRNISLRTLGLSFDSNIDSGDFMSKTINKYQLHILGFKLNVSRSFIRKVMQNPFLRKVGLFVKNRMGGRLS